MSRSSMDSAAIEIGKETDASDGGSSHRGRNDPDGGSSHRGKDYIDGGPLHRGRDDIDGGPLHKGRDDIDGGPLHTDPKRSNDNEFTLRKNYVTHLVDLALLTANSSQLKAVLDVGLSHGYNRTVMAFILTSVAGQILLSIIFAVISGYEKQINNKKEYNMIPAAASDRRRKPPIDYPTYMYVLDHISTGLVLVVVFSNCFVSAFGIETERNTNVTLT